MNKKFSCFLFIILTVFIWTGCKKNNDDRFKIDTSKNRVNIEIKRLDKDIIEIDTTYARESVKALYAKYPVIFPIYVNNILDVEVNDTVKAKEMLLSLLNDTLFHRVNQDVIETFKDISDIERKLSDAFTYIHYYFPKITLPEVYFFISGFNLSVMITDEFFGIGSDMYLGADYPVYEDLTYKYMVNNMKRENIAPDLVSALLFKNFPINTDKERLIDNMLYRGKMLYLLSVFMPDEKEENIIGYTKEQFDWSKHFETEIWATIIDEKHLFSTDNFLIRKYVNDAPFTSPVSQESPGRLGTWVGWQIIKSYMENNKDITLQELIQKNDYQLILEKSGYHP